MFCSLFIVVVLVKLLLKCLLMKFFLKEIKMKFHLKNTKKDIVMTREDEDDIKNSTFCWFCELPLDGQESEIIVISMVSIGELHIRNLT